MPDGIRQITIDKDDSGAYQHVRIVFGPHYFVELTDTEDGVSFVVGATHHGYKADASKVNGQLEQFINEIRNNHPENRVD